jgi:CHAT domain-containing protein
LGRKALPLLASFVFLALTQGYCVAKDITSSLVNFKGSNSLQAIRLLRGSQFGNQKIQNTFKNAGWIFYPDGKFVFIPSQDHSSPIRLAFISGTYTQVGDRFEFQASYQTVGASGSLDGIIRRIGDDLVLDGIYVNSGGSKRQIARISQYLTQQVPGTIKLPNTQTISLSESPRGSQKPPNTSNIPKLENLDEIVIFDVLFEGKTEANKFDSLPGLLFINLNKGSEPPSKVTLTVNPNSLITKGGFFLSTGDSVDPSIQIRGNKNQFQVDFKPSGKMRSLSWFTLPIGRISSTEAIPVIGEAATVTLTIQGKQVTGEIRAKGYSSDNNQPSTYEAKFTGKIQKSQLAEELRTALTAASFNGRWAIDRSEAGKSEFEQIELKQDGQRVTGSFAGKEDGTIEGKILAQNHLEFTWKNQQGEQGRGFFRAIANGGTLTGLWTKNDSKASNQDLVATWQLPTSLIAQSFSPLDNLELRSLGHELSIAGRCEQAVAILDKALLFYRKEWRKSGTSVLELVNRNSNAAAEGFSLAGFSIPCNFQLGDYDHLLEDLDKFLEIQQFFKPEASASRLFQQRTLSLTKTMKSSSETLSIFQNGFNDLRKSVKSSRFTGKIGIRLEQDEKTGALMIAEVVKGQPAASAGVLPQDVLIKIDGRSTRGMSDIQALEKLRGEPETPIVLTVQRNSQEINFKLVRSRVEVYPIARQGEFLQALTFLANYLEELQDRLAHNSNQLTATEAEISQGRKDPVKAWFDLIEDLKRQTAKTNEETDQIFTRGKNIFKDQSILLQEAEVILNAFPRNCGKDREKMDNIDMKKLAERDSLIDLILEESHELTLVEKTLFRANLDLSIYLLTLSFSLDCDRNLMSKIDAKKLFHEHKRQAQETANQLDNYIDRYRRQLIADADKIEALEKGQPFFQRLIPLLVDLDDKQGALVTSEKSRARAFADLLANRVSATQSTAESPTLAQIQQIARTQAATLVEYTIIHDANNKESELLIWVVQPDGEIQSVRQDLKSLQSTLEMFAKDSACPNSSLLPGHELASLIQATHCNIRAAIYSNNDVSPQLKQLHQLLIQPIAGLLPKNPNARVIFIPHRQLYIVPFSALLDTDGKYLIEKHTILTAPSIQVLDSTHQLKQRNVGSVKEIVVVGNPTMPTQQELGNSSNPLDPLPDAQKEAIAIANLFNTQALTGDQATKAAILQQLPQARIIHLATHAEANDNQGLKSWIALAPAGKDDGLLTAEEIFNLYGPPQPNRLQAELIVLSACTTGRGQVTGDGVIGLSRSLIAAGIPSVVVSLWSVQDPATEFLMKEFYNNLQLGKAQALRKAMLKTMKEYSDKPGAWAAFTLIGEP